MALTESVPDLVVLGEGVADWHATITHPGALRPYDLHRVLEGQVAHQFMS